jgi:hypothetical protein
MFHALELKILGIWSDLDGCPLISVAAAAGASRCGTHDLSGERFSPSAGWLVRRNAFVHEM